MSRALLLAGLLTCTLLLTAGCSCQQRLQRLMRACPECFQADTLRLPDTVVPRPVPFMARIPWDDLVGPVPVVVSERRFTLTLTSDGQGVTIDGLALPDTIVRTVEVPVRVPVVVKEPARQPLSPWWAAAGIAAMGLILAIIRTLKNKN